MTRFSISMLAVALMAVSVQAQVMEDAVASGQLENGFESYDLTVADNADRVLIVAFGWEFWSSTINGVFWGEQEMTQLAYNSTQSRTAIYGLVAPDVGNQALYIDLRGAYSPGYTFGAFSLYNADQELPTMADATDVDPGTEISLDFLGVPEGAYAVAAANRNDVDAVTLSDSLELVREDEVAGPGFVATIGKAANLAAGDLTVGITSTEARMGLAGVVVEPVGGGTELLAGDANGDGQVDGNDLISVEENFGATGDPGIGGDASGDGQVDGNDLISVEENFGATSGGPASVPEPATMMLLGLGGLALCRRR